MKIKPISLFLTSREDWVSEGKKRKAKYILVLCDLSNNENYPIYILNYKELNKEKSYYDSQPMIKVIEIYVSSGEYRKNKEHYIQFEPVV